MYTSKRKCHHFDVIIMTGGTESGTIDNWLSKLLQNDTIFVPVYNIPP